MAGLNKGLAALFLEMSQVASAANLVDELLEGYRTAYPGVMDVIDRLLPTYPQHAARRAQEMEELEQTIRNLGLRPCVTRGASHAAQSARPLRRPPLPGETRGVIFHCSSFAPCHCAFA